MLKAGFLYLCTGALFSVSFALDSVSWKSSNEFKKAKEYFEKNIDSDVPGRRVICLELLTKALDGDADSSCVKMANRVLFEELNRLRDKDPSSEARVNADVFDGFLTFCKGIKSQKAVELLVKEVKKSYSDQFVRYKFYVIMGLGFHKTDKQVSKLFSDILKEKDPLYHIAVANAVSAAVAQDDIKLLFDLLEGNYGWETRFESLSALEKLGDNTVVDKLISLLGNARLTIRLKAKLIDVLGVLTKLDLKSDSIPVWQDAWKNKKANDDPRSTGIPPTEFFGLKIRSDRLVFVLDKSGSMQEPLTSEEDPEGPKVPSDDENKFEVTSTTGSGDYMDPFTPKKPLKGQEFSAFKECVEIFNKWMEKKPVKRIEMLQKQMIKTLFKLHGDILFDILLYDSSVFPWKKLLVQADWFNKLDAMRRIDSLVTGNATNISDPVMDGYQYISAKGAKGELTGIFHRDSMDPFSVQDGIDSIVLLTDGEPNMGFLTRKKDIKDFVAKLKPFRKIAFHVIGIGSEIGTDFLKELAESNYGEAKFFK
ncbi:MAG: VWA domain-containing protein [Planctomycetes bacterium]|nr:VWA domain-containing protein [Planctomycetota bacterium]